MISFARFYYFHGSALMLRQQLADRLCIKRKKYRSVKQLAINGSEKQTIKDAR
jgi:CobQ-like glutamine amidotransferase family enzyme